MKWKNDIEGNVRSGLVKLLILHLLSECDMYGYEIRKMLAERTNDAFLMKDAALYGPLYRMASRGLISSHKIMVGEKRFRMYYHTENFGMEYLAYGEEQFNCVFTNIINLFNWEKDQNE